MRGSPMDEEQSKNPRKKAEAAEVAPGKQLECKNLAGDENPRMQWFVLKVQSNRERSIRDSILRRVRMEGMEAFFGQLFIPTEKVVETKGGGRRVREQKVLPGYMMIQMELDDESWHLVRSTSGVGDFTGAAGKPIPMADQEVRRWLGLDVPVESAATGAAAGAAVEKTAKAVVKFEVAVGDHVKVKEGAFESFEGVVDSVDGTTGKVKVIIEIFGRPTEVELEHWQVEKM